MCGCVILNHSVKHFWFKMKLSLIHLCGACTYQLHTMEMLVGKLMAPLQQELKELREDAKFVRSPSSLGYKEAMKDGGAGRLSGASVSLFHFDLTQKPLGKAVPRLSKIVEAGDLYFSLDRLQGPESEFAFPLNVSVPVTGASSPGSNLKATRGLVLILGLLDQYGKEVAKLGDTYSYGTAGKLDPYRRTMVKIPCDFWRSQGPLVDLHSNFQHKEDIGNLDRVEGHTDWELIKEVCATQEELRDHGHEHDSKAVSAFYNGRHATVKTAQMKYKRGKNAVGFLSAEKVATLIGIYDKANDQSLFLPAKPAGPSKLVELIDYLEDTLGLDTIANSWTKLRDMFKLTNSAELYVFVQFYAYERIVQNRLEDEYGRDDLLNKSCPTWHAKYIYMKHVVEKYGHLPESALLNPTLKAYVDKSGSRNLLEPYLDRQKMVEYFGEEGTFTTASAAGNNWRTGVPEVTREVLFARET